MRVHAALEVQHIQARLSHFHRAGLGTLLLQLVVGLGLLLELFQPDLLLGGIHTRRAHITLHLAILFTEIGQLQLPFWRFLRCPKLTAGMANAAMASTTVATLARNRP